MRRTVRGVIAFVSTIIATLLIATGAQAATADQQNVANYVSSLRNAAGLPSLSINEQMNSAAQQWADHLAAVDNRSLSENPNIYQPSGTTNGTSVVAYFSRNDAQAAMDESWWSNPSSRRVINTPSWNTVGTGFAVAKSGAIYLVADLVHVKAPVVMAPPAPAPVQAPVVVPAPVVVQPAPAPAAPIEQAPAQSDPASAPAPAAPDQATPGPDATEAPKPAVTPSPTPTATFTPGASESAKPPASSISTNNQSMDAERTSENTAAALAKQPKQIAGFSAMGLLLICGGSLSFANRDRKA